MLHPGSVSVVILTRDEAAHIAECLDACLAQLREGDEAIIVDAASRDGTLAICERYALIHAGRVRIHAFPVRVSPGEARNTGVEMAKHDVIAFLSADAVPEPGWLDAMRAASQRADIVYGRQRHAPPSTNAATVARGLEYHRYESDERVPLAETYASNVNAAYSRFAFQSLKFDDELPEAEDVAFAKRARLAGLRIAYAPEAVVGHREVASLSDAWSKQVTEGAVRARLRELVGVPTLHLAWVFAVLALSIAALAFASAWLLGAALVVLFAPGVRRLLSPAARRYSALPLAGGAALSPFLDLAFVASYVANRLSPRRA